MFYEYSCYINIVDGFCRNVHIVSIAFSKLAVTIAKELLTLVLPLELCGRARSL